MRIFSPIISGSAYMSSGSTLFGTSSWAISSSNAITASYAMNAAPIQPFPYNGTVTPAVVSGSLLVSGSGITVTGSVSISGSLNATASWANNVLTASYVTGSVFSSINPALSASYASGSTSASYASFASTIFPFSGSAIITGSLRITGSGITSTGSVNITQGTFNIDGVNVLDTALAYAIALG